MPSCEVFCTIMSTFTCSSASARNSAAAMPGRSGTRVIVSLASEVSLVTAETMGCSMAGSSSVTQVPGSQVKLERTWSGTWWFAGELDRAEREHPPAGGGDLQHLLEGDPLEAPGARDDPGVGAEDPGDVGVDLAAVRPERGGERHGGRVRATPPEGRHVPRARDALESGDDRDDALGRGRPGAGRPGSRGSSPWCGWCR